MNKPMNAPCNLHDRFAREMRNLGLRGLAFGGAVMMLAALHSAPVAAFDFHYDLARPEELRECDAMTYRGKRDDAQSCYMEVYSETGSYYIRALASWSLGDLSGANTLFRAALQREPASGMTRIAWAHLFLKTHQYDEALKLFREVRNNESLSAQAKLGSAMVLAERYDGTARQLLDEVIKSNGDWVAPHVLLARMDLEEGQLAEAEASIDKAQALAEKQKWPLLEMYAQRAALDVLRGGDGAKWIKRALDYNPRFGAVYETIAHLEVMRRRYAEAAALLEKAVALDPGLASAQAELGLNYLRLGKIDAGQKHLATAYEIDPYSVTTVNTLRLLDRFNEFDVLRLDRVGKEVAKDVPALVELRLHRSESAVLKPYVHAMARDAIASFSERYKFAPKDTVTIEVFPNHDDFAVRVGGLPGIGLLGVTFGYLLAMDSPSGRSRGEFHWGSTLWHEMAHVFTLEATDHRVPRWLSEGISVFEEWRTGPTPGVVVTPDVITALREGKFLPIEDLDGGFIRPRYQNQVQVSYSQAGLTCLFIEQRFGFEKLVALLEQFKHEVQVGQAVKASLGVTAADFDKQFAEFVKQRYAPVLAKSDVWQQLFTRAAQAAEQGKWSDVIEPAQQAIEIYPEFVGESAPYLLLAKAQAELKNPAEQLAALLKYRAAGGWDPDALRRLGQALKEAGRESEALDVFAAVNYSDPLEEQSHLKLGDALFDARRVEEAEREYQAALSLNAHDKASAYFGLARAKRALGDQTAARRQILQALELAPHFKPAQQLLLEMADGK